MAALADEREAMIEERLMTILVDADPVTGEECQSETSKQLAQAMRQLAGRMVHGVVGDAEHARLEDFLFASEQAVEQQMRRFALDVEEMRAEQITMLTARVSRRA